jgi:hypothetical protein
MTAAKILSLIETVEPGDEARLDEIDARVHALYNNCVVRKMGDGRAYYTDYGYTAASYVPQYTRSRDALKSIRPPEWEFYCCDFSRRGGNDTGYNFEAYRWTSGHRMMCPYMPTEELAELWCIISAIRHDRGETHG